MSILSFSEYLNESYKQVNEDYYAGPVFAEENPAYKAKLATAIRMEKDGASQDDIYTATDWFKGKYDKKWRVEMADHIDLSDFPFEPTDDPIYGTVMEGCTTLSTIIKDIDFLRAYPRIAALEVQLFHAPSLQNEAEYTPSKKLIFTQGPTIESLIPYIVHEIQHAIQTDEDYARGGEPDMFKRNEKGHNRSLKNRKDMYMSLAGEIEARDTQTRYGYSATQRKHIKPFSSEDYPEDTARVIYDD